VITKVNDIFEKAVQFSAESRPNSVIIDLLMLFPIDVVTKILITFEGEFIKFPSVHSIMNSYRANVIKTTLDADNAISTRKRLAAYFGISYDFLMQIYRRECKNRQEVRPKTVKKSAKRARKYLLDEYLQDAKETIYSK